MSEQSASWESIEDLLERARQGDKRALETACQRSKALLLAAALKTGLSWRDAVASVPEHLKFFCREVLDGKLQPSLWRKHIVHQAESAVPAESSADAESEGLAGMRSIPRLARRRVLRDAAVALTLPQLSALLLKHMDGATPAEMVGLAADAEDEAAELLVGANDALTNALEQANLFDDEDQAGNRQQLVDDTMRELIESEPLSASLAEDTANALYQEKFGTAVDFGATSGSRGVNLAGGLGASQMISRNAAILFAIGTAFLGYLFGSRGGAGQNSQEMMQQLYRLNAYSRGRGDVMEMMMLNNMFGGSGGGLFPSIGATVKTACLIAVLLWITRSRLWKHMFPAKKPAGLTAARWFGLLAALIGIAKCLAHAFVSYTLMSMSNRGGSDSQWFMGTLSAADQLWSIAFWLTLVILGTTVIDHVAIGAIAPQQREA